MHASGTRTGQLGDVMPIQLMMYHMRQIVAKSLISQDVGLTQAERMPSCTLGCLE